METYVELARSLPIPGPGQTRAFANYLTGAHSWYKRWDQFAFTFFLDPNVGRTEFLSPVGARFEDKTGVAVRPGQTTASYREHFGYWNYAHSFRDPPRVQAAGGRSLEIPPDLIRAGTAAVNKLMYGRKRSPATERELDSEDEMRFGGIFVSIPSAGYTNSLQNAMAFGSDLSRLPPAIANALQPLATLWSEESYRRELLETGRALAEILDKVYALKEGYFDDRMKALGGDRIREETRAAWQRTESRRREKELLRAVLVALDAERERQVAGMVNAMIRFLAVLGKA